MEIQDLTKEELIQKILVLEEELEKIKHEQFVIKNLSREEALELSQIIKDGVKNIQELSLDEDYCIMPKKLSYENGAKAHLLGQFYVVNSYECPYCDEYSEEYCELCGGNGFINNKFYIDWTTIKNIYVKAVECCAKN